MNERIRELADLADFVFGRYNNNAVLCSAIDINKFAKLIVRECANIVTDAVDHREPASTYADKIRQHFGVEE